MAEIKDIYGRLMYQGPQATVKELIASLEKPIAVYDIRIDLCAADLSWVDLEGADLSGVDLSWSDLYDANLRGADLSKADLTYASLEEADLKNSNLRGACLHGVDIDKAKNVPKIVF
jgi:uncharacterized protein YjbI with pentapeptide repeats